MFCNENQYTSIQICSTLFYILLKACFAIKDINTDLVLLLSDHLKYLLISHIWQLWHVITYERDSAGLSDLRQSFCHPMSWFVFMNSEMFICCCKKTAPLLRKRKLVIRSFSIKQALNCNTYSWSLIYLKIENNLTRPWYFRVI